MDTVRLMSYPARIGAAIGLGYLLGTFPTAHLVTRRATGGEVDIRSAGTGNPGTANTYGVLGTSAAAQVLVGDVAKGAAACALGGAVAGPIGAHVAGSASVAGHCYPVWTGFRGGKGVATSVGQCLATFPAYFPIDAVVAVGTAAVPRWKERAFAATVVSTTCWVAGGMMWWRRGFGNLWGPRPTPVLPAAAAISSAMIVQRFIAERSTSRPSR